MPDLQKLHSVATTGDATDEVPVTRRLLAKLVEMAMAGQTAEAREGQVFGLKQGQRI